LYALDDHVWGIKITALEESADFATLDTEKLFSQLKSHTSKAFITSARVGGNDAKPTNAGSSALEFALSSVTVASDEQYESIPDDETALLARKFHALQKFCMERRRSPKGCFMCSDTTHFIVNFPKRKKLDSSNKYNYINRNDYSNKGDNKKKNHFRDNNNNNNNKKSQACAP
jgi:hypothetical protein